MSSPSNVEPVDAIPVEEGSEQWPAGKLPRLVAQRGAKPGLEYLIYEGENYMGRTDEQPVDINLEDQENPEQVWSSRQHACVRFQNGKLTIDDLKSANFTYVNRVRVMPGEPRVLRPGDMIQIGNIHLRVEAK